MSSRVYVSGVVRTRGIGFNKLCELLGLMPCSPGSGIDLASEKATKHVLEMLQEHSEPVKLLVPCNNLQGRGNRYTIIRYGDAYCEMVGGFNCGYGGTGPYEVSNLIKRYLNIEALIDDPVLYAAHRDFIENKNYQDAAILVELCSGRAYITVYKLS